MQRIVSALILALSLSLLPAAKAEAWFFGDSTLVSIDGTNYSTEDFKTWWQFWKDPDSQVPETPDFYIDWLLLVREGQRMELDTEPGFKRATTVFLQSRTLLRLKYEEIDSKIKVTDAVVRDRYEQRYVPRWLLEGFEFKDSAAAMDAWQKWTAGTLTIEELRKLDSASGGPVKTTETQLRKKDVENSPRWAELVKTLVIGEPVSPEKLGKGSVMWYLKEIKGADDEDFARLREELSKDIQRERETELTVQLLARLREKYEVKIDEARLDALDLKADDATFTDAYVITSNRQNVSEKEFVAIMRRLFASRPMMAGAMDDEQEIRKLKLDTAYNVIAQSVTNWESLDRHYEEQEPFKWEYEFNYNHRLVQALEQRMFAAQATVSEDEIKQVYETNKSRYSVPMQVQLYIVDETQGPIDRVWSDVATGMSIDKALAAHMEKHSGSKEFPANHLDPEVKVVVDKMVEGETSPIFTAKGSRVFVHLAKRIPEQPIPYARVKESISQELFTKKVKQLQEDYLKILRANSQIEVRQGEWKDVRKELGGA